MALTNPVGVVAATFLFLQEKDAGFIGALKTRCALLPDLTVWRIGGVINYMVEKNLVDPAAAAGQIQGFYPNCRSTGGLGTSVPDALARINLVANLNAAMQCVVGIQTDAVMLGVNAIVGAGNTALRGASGVYQAANTTFNALDKSNDVRGKLVQLRDYVRAQRGASTEIFINAM